MWNLFLYHLASGHAWFSGGAVFLVVAALDAGGFFDTRRRLASAARILLIIGVILAGLAGTSPSLWLAVPLLVCCVGYSCIGFCHRSRRLRLGLAASAVALVVAGVLVELPYHFPSLPQTPRPRRLYILGDSLAAGVGIKEITWPKLLAERTGIQVSDLSLAGATARNALRQQAPALERSTDTEAWVLVEIGGNDMLGGPTADEFGEALDRLLVIARGDPASPRTVIMLEVPLTPGKWAFGAWQRQLAVKHGASLVPKRVMAGVILTDANVLDGLHLSQAGHERLADLLIPWLGQP
ncbi:MAG TPA: GDSL-type esterase/lipase family protein [Gemmataceae bacterium]|nr:GDSL-type esterase/lipase family protein [Gemmataceae bacterium]